MEQKKSAKKKAVKQVGTVLWIQDSYAGPVFPRVDVSEPNNINFTSLIGKKSKIIITITD